VSGFHVRRRFGWDTHGLPVEHEIDKKLGITGKDDVMAMGIDKYNAECRSTVMLYSGEWRRTVERMGRWIDFDDDYKTLNTSFMESVWWAFDQLYKKGMVYRGFRVLPYSTGCTTPLSNFEAGLAYRDVNDPAGELYLFDLTLVLIARTPSYQLPSHFLWSMIPIHHSWRGRQRLGLFPRTLRSAFTPIITISKFTIRTVTRILSYTRTS
jgi:tRNA synthetases class I (I, L, M and V)